MKTEISDGCLRAYDGRTHVPAQTNHTYFLAVGGNMPLSRRYMAASA